MVRLYHKGEVAYSAFEIFDTVLVVFELALMHFGNTRERADVLGVLFRRDSNVIDHDFEILQIATQQLKGHHNCIEASSMFRCGSSSGMRLWLHFEFTLR